MLRNSDIKRIDEIQTDFHEEKFSLDKLFDCFKALKLTERFSDLTYTGGKADKYRAGVLSFGIVPFRIGRNSEQIHKVFQNQFAHDMLTGGDAKWFRVLDIKPRWYWHFGTGSGNTLW